MSKLVQKLCLIGLLGMVSYALATSSIPDVQTIGSQPLGIMKTTQQQLTPRLTLEALEAGNQRFMESDNNQYDYMKAAKYTAKNGQFPSALVFSCMDSRSIPEILFNQNIGSIFTLRMAGNVLDENSLASMEYGVKSGIKLIVVLAHTQCGAVTAACQAGNLKDNHTHLPHLLSSIQTAVKQEAQKQGGKDCESPQFISAVASQNAKLVMQAILSRSPFIREAVVKHQVGIVAGIHHLDTGKVEFFNSDNLFPVKS